MKATTQHNSLTITPPALKADCSPFCLFYRHRPLQGWSGRISYIKMIQQ